MPVQRGHSVFFIIPYDYVISTDEYIKYFDAYVVPQVQGWMSENALASNTMYLSCYFTGVAKVREKLKSNAAWVAPSENKQKIRVEKQTIIAEELLPAATTNQPARQLVKPAAERAVVRNRP
jgi:hypothetical protein